jgi:septal ring factor EnvC (AmiA/AmiB activator)
MDRQALVALVAGNALAGRLTENPAQLRAHVKLAREMGEALADEIEGPSSRHAELEAKVTHLEEENAHLRTQLADLRVATTHASAAAAHAAPPHAPTPHAPEAHDAPERHATASHHPKRA